MTKRMSREIRLKSRPAGLPRESDFELARVPVPDPGPGELLVRNLYVSVDPYMRGRMRAGGSYAGAFELGKPVPGASVGRVVASEHPGFPPGAFVLSESGWREWFASDGAGLRPIDPALAPVQAYLGVLGMPGLTAYVGLLDIGALRPGEAVFVSAAAGAVGSVACQIARIKGCRVAGSAGSGAKIHWLLDEAGIDAAVNYREAADLGAALRQALPGGVDVYFDNVGGAHLEAALDHMKRYGRVVLCGSISRYNATGAIPGPSNLSRATGERLTLRGFIVSDHWDRLPQFYADMGAWIAAGRIKWRETVVEGIENAPRAFIGLFRGENVGKMLVQVGA